MKKMRILSWNVNGIRAVQKKGFVDWLLTEDPEDVYKRQRQGEGINELLSKIHDVATGKYICKPYRLKTNSSELNSAIEKLSNEIELEYPGLPNLRWVALRLSLIHI